MPGRPLKPIHAHRTRNTHSHQHRHWRQLVAGCCLLGLALLGNSSANADEPTSSHTAPIENYINAQTTIIGWVDISQVDLKSLADFAQRHEISADALLHLSSAHEVLVQLGVRRIYWSGDLSDLSAGPGAFIVPLEQSKADSIRLALDIIVAEQVTAVVDGSAVLFGDAARVQELKQREKNPADKEFLAHVNALRQPHGLAVRLSSSMLSPLGAALPELLKGRDVHAQDAIDLLSHLKAVTWSTDLPPTSGQFRIMTDSSEDAALITDMANRLIAEELKSDAAPLRLMAEGNSAALKYGDSNPANEVLASLQKLATPARIRATSSRVMNSLKQLALAMHNFHASHNSFPPQSLSDENGNRLLSWRVLVLPYLDELELYEKFRLNEPWDSEHNKKLIPLMPAVFRNDPAVSDEQSEKGLTRFVAPLTQDSLFGHRGPGVAIGNMIDGTSNTLMLVQTTSEQAVIWTKPEDLTIDPTDPLASIISEKESGFHCCFADGSARLIPRTISTKTLNALLSFAGREVVDEEF